jgi:nicotinamide-nucleotide amidase
MKIEIVNTGDELLLGDTVNTNAAWLGQQIAALGGMVSRHTVVPDGAAIQQAIAEAAARADVVLVSGGLGPTGDDVTREAAAELLGLPVHLDAGVQADLEAFFAQRGRPMVPENLKQAMVPAGAVILPNPYGTAPGLYFPADIPGAPAGWKTHLFLLPGPPRELKPMVESQVEPRLRALLPEASSRQVLYLKVTGLGESEIIRRVEKPLSAVPGLTLGYCIRMGDVDVRLSGASDSVEMGAAIVRTAMGDCIVSEDKRVIEEVLVSLLTERGQTLATAESCTGGYVASRLTDVSGASRVFEHGFVTYANAAKQRWLGVSEALLTSHGAVSEPVARAMAEGALLAAGGDHALALTGIAGPNGGSEEKPVGTVFMALASKGQETLVRRCFFPTTRERFKLLAAQAVFDLLRRRLLGLQSPE